jgi:polyhydroxybutyrate depolymerase
MKIACVFAFCCLLLHVEAQVISDSLLVDGHYRTFHYNLPLRPWADKSLVFVLHGSGGSGVGIMRHTSKLEAMAAASNFLVVYPDGYQRYWNECRKSANSLANQIDIDEGAFFNGMIGFFESRYGINRQHVFAVGTSGGGHMCYKLALTMPGTFRAITAIIANLPDTDNLDCVEAGVALPVMIVNGTADPLNKYEGGMMQSGDFIMGNVRSTDRTFEYWSQLAGYTGDPTKELLPDNDPADGKTIERYTFKKKGKPEIVLLKVIGGKHDYPKDIDVHVAAWEFFTHQL